MSASRQTGTTTLLALLCAAPVFAQPPPPAKAAPLLPPAGVFYQYWPLQFVQWVGPELPYSMILLYDDNRAKQPLYDVELVGRDGGKRVHYVNTPALLALDKAKGYETYQVRMQLDGPAEPQKGAQYLLRFDTEKEVPVVWQFVQGTDVSDQGSGVTPIDAKIPVFLYREQGALAGQGTALKIGSTTSTAEVWQQYARPPYFVPYHGALTQGAHILSIAPLTTAWTDPQPAHLAEGADWKLTSAHGTVLDAKVEAVKKGIFTVSMTDSAREISITLNADAAGALTRARYGPSGEKPEHSLSLAFTPGLASGVTSKFELVAGKKKKIAAGTVEDTAGKLTWTVTGPDWAKGKTATANVSVSTP